MVEWTPLLVLGIIFWGILSLVKTVADNKLRNRLVEKGMVDKNIQALFQRGEEPVVSSSLKWGIVLIAVGLALVIGQLVPHEMSGEMTAGTMFLLVGIAMLVYYVIASRMAKKK